MGEGRTEEQNVVVAPERHDYTRALVDGSRLDVIQTTGLPDCNLTIAHLAETGCCNSVVLSHPNNTRAL